jgi:cyclophilin family peptidyl-prolyl cis-trans isomerase
VPDETTTPLVAPVRLVFHTDAGELPLTLDPRIAPVAVARIVRLARAGFYDGMAVHRYLPGFLVQLGDPDGDGYSDGSVIPIASELAPVPFEPWDVGLALGGPDTGTVQIFVALGRWPHLDEHYPLLGHADPAWGRLGLGDVIHKVEVGP